MSSKQNNNNTIHLGNYEEFFILYMDNELSSSQIKMVDEFLAANPDLQTEFRILMSTKLPAEEFTIEKEELMADSMKLDAIDEELLLYIDHELSPDKAKIIASEIASNKDYHIRHELLLQTKLDVSEKIAYPNKLELYHKTEKQVVFKMWMRIAVALILVSAMGVLYFMNLSSTRQEQPALVEAPVIKQATPENPIITPEKQIITHDQKPQEKLDVAINQNKKENYSVARTKNSKIQKNTVKVIKPVQQSDDLIAHTNRPDNQIASVDKSTLQQPMNNIATEKLVGSTASNNPDLHKGSFNNPLVTPDSDNRITITETPPKGDVTKGSVKGFLRRATRLIEKRTGIDPTNDNGELLLGFVAVKLK